MKLPNAPAMARVPFFVVEGAGNGASVGASVGAGKRVVGSVAREHLAALRGWPGMLEVDERSVTLVAADRSAALAEVHAALRSQGLIRAWRDESFALFDPGTHEVLATMERAAARFWGTLTLGAHANGYVTDGDGDGGDGGGRPVAMWIARRAFDKATDPGLFDNLIGGGVPAGQTPQEALQREGWEEAGLSAACIAAAVPAGVLRLHRDVPEGCQLEDLHVFDLALPPTLLPHNQDGEVADFRLLPVAEALALAAGSSALGAMTVDAALVTLDFGRRHGLLAGAAARAMAAALFTPAV